MVSSIDLGLQSGCFTASLRIQKLREAYGEVRWIHHCHWPQCCRGLVWSQVELFSDGCSPGDIHQGAREGPKVKPIIDVQCKDRIGWGWMRMGSWCVWYTWCKDVCSHWCQRQALGCQLMLVKLLPLEVQLLQGKMFWIVLMNLVTPQVNLGTVGSCRPSHAYLQEKRRNHVRNRWRICSLDGILNAFFGRCHFKHLRSVQISWFHI